MSKLKAGEGDVSTNRDQPGELGDADQVDAGDYTVGDTGGNL